jgi:hypothetical protein
MATRSTIAMELDNGTVKEVYCHWDGYLENNGKILNEHYRDVKKINTLMELGNVSSLGPEIGLKHDFDHRETKWTKFYGRDRGEEDQAAQEYSSYEEYCEKGNRESFNYIYRHGEWFVDGEKLEEKLKNLPKE